MAASFLDSQAPLTISLVAQVQIISDPATEATAPISTTTTTTIPASTTTTILPASTTTVPAPASAAAVPAAALLFSRKLPASSSLQTPGRGPASKTVCPPQLLLWILQHHLWRHRQVRRP